MTDPINVMRLRRTICETRDSWFHLGHDGHVYVVNQRHGDRSTGTATLTAAEFEKFVRFYRKAKVLARKPAQRRLK